MSDKHDSFICRNTVAEMLGYKNYAEMVINRQMVGSLANLSHFLNS